MAHRKEAKDDEKGLGLEEEAGTGVRSGTPIVPLDSGIGDHGHPLLAPFRLISAQDLR